MPQTSDLLEKSALIFLYNFHREHSLLKLIIKKLSPKINVKNIKNRVFFFLTEQQRHRSDCNDVKTSIFVEIGTDKPTSGKISIPQVVSVAEVTGLSLTWSQTQYLCQHDCVSTLHTE